MEKDREQHFHWSEGMKYAVEGLKSLFVLNGAATIAILTFIGNTQNGDDRLAYCMLAFSFGALLCPVSFIFAYVTQLNYGNGDHTNAFWFHKGTYAIVAVSCIAFVFGIVLAASAFIAMS